MVETCIFIFNIVGSLKRIIFNKMLEAIFNSRFWTFLYNLFLIVRILGQFGAIWLAPLVEELNSVSYKSLKDAFTRLQPCLLWH
jgi:hypothetical protein